MSQNFITRFFLLCGSASLRDFWIGLIDSNLCIRAASLVRQRTQGEFALWLEANYGFNDAR